MYSFRGSFDDNMVGAEKILTEQGLSQSCDEEQVAVELVVNLHRAGYSAIHLDVVSIHYKELDRIVGGVLHAAFLLVREHANVEDRS